MLHVHLLDEQNMDAYPAAGLPTTGHAQSYIRRQLFAVQHMLRKKDSDLCKGSPSTQQSSLAEIKLDKESGITVAAKRGKMQCLRASMQLPSTPDYLGLQQSPPFQQPQP